MSCCLLLSLLVDDSAAIILIAGFFNQVIPYLYCCYYSCCCCTYLSMIIHTQQQQHLHRPRPSMGGFSALKPFSRVRLYHACDSKDTENQTALGVRVPYWATAPRHAGASPKAKEKPRTSRATIMMVAHLCAVRCCVMRDPLCGR